MAWQTVKTKDTVYFVDGDALKQMPNFVKADNVYRISHDLSDYSKEPWYNSVHSILIDNPNYPISEIMNFVVGYITSRLDPKKTIVVLMGGKDSEYLDCISEMLQSLGFTTKCMF